METFKISIGEKSTNDLEIRKFALEKARISLQLFLRWIQSLYPTLVMSEYAITWIDKERDVITLETELEFQLAVHEMVEEKKSIRFHLKRKGNPGSCNKDESSTSEKWVNVVCDGCDTGPLSGMRFKCMTCPDFDLCKDCHMSGKHSHHKMMRMIPNKQFSNPLRSHFSSFAISPFDSLCSPSLGKRQYCGPNACPQGFVVVDVDKQAKGSDKKDETAHSTNGTSAEDKPNNSSYEGADKVKVIHTPFGPLVRFGPSFISLNDFKSDNGEKDIPSDEKNMVRITKAPNGPTFYNTDEKEKVEEKGEAKSNNDNSNDSSIAKENNKKDDENQEQTQPKSDKKESENPEGSFEVLSKEELVENQSNQEEGAAAKEKAHVPVHPDPRINAALTAMLNMGFNDDGGWLTKLLDSKQGNVGAVLDCLLPPSSE